MSDLPLNALDIICVLIVLFHLIIGTVKGATWQIMRIASIVLGFWCASRYGQSFLDAWPESLMKPDETYGIYVAKVALFLSVYLAFFFLTHLLKSIIDKIKLGSWDRALGAVFGAAKGAAICSCILYLQFIDPIAAIPAVQDQLDGNEEKEIQASYADDLFDTYVEPQVKRLLPADGIGDTLDGLTDDIVSPK